MRYKKLKKFFPSTEKFINLIVTTIFMIGQILFPDHIESLAEHERDRKFLLMGRTDNDLGYLRFEDPLVNARRRKFGHEGIATIFLEEIKSSGETIPYKYRGGGLAKFCYREERIHIIFSGESKDYGKFDEGLLRRIMDTQTGISYRID